MLSLHHITHAVSVVIICFLLKKYIELRVQHGDLRHKYEWLLISCGSNLQEAVGGTCSCLGQTSFQSKTEYAQVGTEVRHYHPTEENFRQYVSESKSIMFAGQVGPSDVVVDDYGRTEGYMSADKQLPSQYRRSADSISGFSAEPHLPPLHHPSVPDQQAPVQPSFTFSGVVPMATKRLEILNARYNIDGKTDVTNNEQMTSSLLRTSESLGLVNMSPSETFQKGGSQISQANTFTDRSSVSTAQDDFYLGSHMKDAAEENEQQILTTGSFPNAQNAHDDHLHTGLQGTPFIPNYIDTSFEDESEKEWETEDEYNAKPSFVRLPLHQLSDSELEKIIEQGTSVQCSGSTISERMCHFQNLCFEKKFGKFILLRGKNSVVTNVPFLEQNQPLLELSTVAGHNAQYFSYTEKPAGHIKGFHIAVIPGTTIIFRRFKPDNIMHALHDDIIPLFHTLHLLKIKPLMRGHTDGKFPLSVFLTDENDEGEFFGLYDIFAADGIFTRESVLATNYDYLCFPEAHVGLSKTTTWYQYGFFQPQGPILDSSVTSYYIHNVGIFLLNHFAQECPMCGTGGHIVLILRKETRRIVNEMELIMAINREFRLKVMTISFETHELSDMIPIILSARGIIGMHGSLLSLAMFLRQGAVVIELFPYAVDPSRYTPYKSLCEVPGMGITYSAWRNSEFDSSVPHPDWPPELGGIHHLPVGQQQEISAQTDIPVHLCCEDPSWLYHIFQDTIVNIPEVLALMKSALEESKVLWADNDKLSMSKMKMTPGPVQNLKCRTEISGGKPNLLLHWELPWNIMDTKDHNMEFRIHLQEPVSGEHFHLEAGKKMVYKVSEGVRTGVEYIAWVRCVLGGVQGPFASMVKCHTK